jgi:hypothetical protein
VGTAHGNNLSNLMRNPVLRPLVGGVNAVTIGDVMAAKMNSSVKVRFETASRLIVLQYHRCMAGDINRRCQQSKAVFDIYSSYRCTAVLH